MFEKTTLVILTKARYFISSQSSLYKILHLQLDKSHEFIFTFKSKAASNLVAVYSFDEDLCVHISLLSLDMTPFF